MTPNKRDFIYSDGKGRNSFNLNRVPEKLYEKVISTTNFLHKNRPTSKTAENIKKKDEEEVFDTKNNETHDNLLDTSLNEPPSISISETSMDYNYEIILEEQI
mgnify:CR=1 FL=1